MPRCVRSLQMVAFRRSLVLALSLLCGLSSIASAQPASPNVALVDSGGLCLATSPVLPPSGPEVYVEPCASTSLRYLSPPRGFDQPLRDADGQCLDVPVSPALPGASVAPRACDDTSRQLWRLSADDAIVHIESGLCLAPLGEDASESGAVGVATCDQGPAQRWTLRSFGRFLSRGVVESAIITTIATGPAAGHVWIGTESGLFRSLDDGATFFPIAGGLPTARIEQLVIDPIRPDVAFVLALSSLRRTIDGGRSWQTIWSNAERFARHPATGRLWAFAAGTTTAATIAWRSDDDGATWTAIANPQTSDRFGFRYTDVVVDPSDPDRVWIAKTTAGTNLSFWDRGIWRTTDGGATWSRDYDDDDVLSLSLSNDRDVLYAIARSHGLLVTRDGGATWNEIGLPPGHWVEGSLALDGTTLYVAGDVANSSVAALWAYDTVAGTWSDLGRALETDALFSTLHVDAGASGDLFAGVRRFDADADLNGLWRRDATSGTWALSTAGLSTGFPDRVVADGHRRFAIDGSILRVSRDSGTTWSVATHLPTTGRGVPGAQAPAPFILRPPTTAGQAAHLFAGAPFGGDTANLLRSTDGGETWTELVAVAPERAVRGLTFDPDDPTRLFATINFGQSVAGSIYRSIDDGTSWTRVGPDDFF
ncbi:MAG: ricin-type beta-trefoil lectin domain protein, partial [Acidobacteriota bacterium]